MLWQPTRPNRSRLLLRASEKITVEMTVQAAKDRLENRGEIYLDSETDFRDEKNFAVVITKAGAASLKESGIEDPAAHFKDKKIRATGTVKEVDKVPRIEVDDAKQIRIVEANQQLNLHRSFLVASFLWSPRCSLDPSSSVAKPLAPRDLGGWREMDDVMVQGRKPNAERR